MDTIKGLEDILFRLSELQAEGHDVSTLIEFADSLKEFLRLIEEEKGE